MIHARTDYQRFVILFRAQDKHFISVLRNYLNRLHEDDPEGSMTMQVAPAEHINRAAIWQRQHKIKNPDMPDSCLPAPPTV